MTQPQPKLEAVAEAMWCRSLQDPNASSGGYNAKYWLALAQAALDALQLTPEKRTLEDGWGGISINTETGVTTSHGKAATVESRLVSPWVAIPQQENQP